MEMYKNELEIDPNSFSFTKRCFKISGFIILSYDIIKIIKRGKKHEEF